MSYTKTASGVILQKGIASAEPFENLANAIVLQAVKDYRDALKRLEDFPAKEEYSQDAAALERFFRSQWYRTLTAVDGEMLIRKLRKEADV